MKKGFTIIELLMVVAILAVLLGIVTTAATASIRQARERRTQAMKQTLQNGIAAYRTRKDEWPGQLENWAKVPPSNDGTVGYLSTLPNGDYDKVVQVLIGMSAGKSAVNRVMDPVGLLVMSSSTTDGKSGGRDFREVVKKNNRHTKTMSPREMTIVYQEKETGHAYRYVIEYNTESDAVTVMTQGEYNSKYSPEKWNGGEKWH